MPTRHRDEVESLTFRVYGVENSAYRKPFIATSWLTRRAEDASRPWRDSWDIVSAELQFWKIETAPRDGVMFRAVSKRRGLGNSCPRKTGLVDDQGELAHSDVEKRIFLEQKPFEE